MDIQDLNFRSQIENHITGLHKRKLNPIPFGMTRLASVLFHLSENFSRIDQKGTFHFYREPLDESEDS